MFKQTLTIKRNVYICVVNPLNVNNETANGRKKRGRGAVYFLLIHSLQRWAVVGIRLSYTHGITALRGCSRTGKGTLCFPAPETRRSTLWPHLPRVTSPVDNNSVRVISDSHGIINISSGIRRRVVW
jgi:hypothetical protein